MISAGLDFGRIQHLVFCYDKILQIYQQHQAKTFILLMLYSLGFAWSCNSIRDKFEAPIQNVSGEVDLLMVSEKKIDESQFLIKSFSDPFRTNRNIHWGGILLYVRKGIPTNLLCIEPIPSECFFAELNLCKSKWLMSCSYNPHKINISKHIEILSKNLDLYSSQHESNIIFDPTCRTPILQNVSR